MTEDELVENWEQEAERCMQALGVEQFHMTFSGGNDQGGIDEMEMTYPDGRKEVPEENIGTAYQWVNIGGLQRDVHYKTLMHPKQRLVNDLINAVWTPVGEEYGGFATGDDSHVAGDIFIDLTEEEHENRFQVDLGQWVTTHWCMRGEHELDFDGQHCEECAKLPWCAECQEIEVEKPGDICEECQENAVDVEQSDESA